MSTFSSVNDLVVKSRRYQRGTYGLHPNEASAPAKVSRVRAERTLMERRRHHEPYLLFMSSLTSHSLVYLGVCRVVTFKSRPCWVPSAASGALQQHKQREEQEIDLFNGV